MATKKIIIYALVSVAIIFAIHRIFFVPLLEDEIFNTYLFPLLVSLWLLLSTAQYLQRRRKHPISAGIVFLYWSAVKIITGGAFFLYLAKNYMLVHTVTLVADFMILYTVSLFFELFIVLRQPQKTASH